MRAGTLLLSILAVGCARPAPPAAPPSAPAQAPVPALLLAPAPVTCGDAGVLLRGEVADPKLAGPSKEAAIARTCRLEKWSPELLSCVGGKPQPRACLARLTAPQRAAYDQALTAWNENFSEETLDDATDDVTGVGSYVDCGDAIREVAAYAPAVTLAGADRDFVVQMRQAALLHLCEGWPTEQRACFRDADPTDLPDCRAQLDPDDARALTDKLAEIDRIGGKLAAQQRTPAGYDCKQAVGVHYADAAWKGTMPTTQGADRARAIAESRARMLKACADEQWPPALRACIAAGGGEPCFTTVPRRRWQFPAIGVIVKTGIPECDAHAQITTAVTACATLPPALRDRIQDMWDDLIARASSAPPEARAGTAASCQQIDSMLRQILTKAGCKI